jgi:glycosyltransferase involved in cell wall biosynthesis
VDESLVSVVIPLFNKQSYISSTLQSVIDQDYETIELILIDDGSTDRGYELACDILKENQSRFKRVITISKTNQGQTAARNAGIAQASGEYVALLDADDVWAPMKLRKQVEVLDLNPAINLVLCNYMILFTNIWRTKAVSLRPLDKKIRSWLLTTGYGAGLESTGLIRRTSFRSEHIFDPALQMCGGLDLTFRMVEEKSVLCLKEYLCGYRIVGGGWHANKEDLLKSFRHLLEEKDMYDSYAIKIKLNLMIHLRLWEIRKKPTFTTTLRFFALVPRYPFLVSLYLISTARRVLVAQLRSIFNFSKVKALHRLVQE